MAGYPSHAYVADSSSSEFGDVCSDNANNDCCASAPKKRTVNRLAQKIKDAFAHVPPSSPPPLVSSAPAAASEKLRAYEAARAEVLQAVADRPPHVPIFKPRPHKKRKSTFYEDALVVAMRRQLPSRKAAKAALKKINHQGLHNKI